MKHTENKKNDILYVCAQTTDSPKLHECIPGFPCCISKLVVVPSLNEEIVGAPLFPVQSRSHSNDPSVWINL